MTFADINLALAIIVIAYALALPSWFLRQSSARVRTLVLIGQWIALFTLPWFYPAKPVVLKTIVALSCCGALPPKLLDMHLHPGHWVGLPIREWLAYLINPFIIVHRLHTSAPAGLAAGWRLAIRGVLQMALGGVILWFAFCVIDFGGPRWSFSLWLEHAIKLIGAYLLVFDGAFVFATGVIRMLGEQVLDLSKEPAAAATPADFWRRYNCEAGRFLREDLFYPLGGRRHPVVIAVVTFLINGLLHEYLALIMVGRILGFQMLFFALHGTAVAITLRWRLRGAARLAGIVGTVLFLYFTTIFFFATVDLFVPWYSRDIAH